MRFTCDTSQPLAATDPEYTAKPWFCEVISTRPEARSFTGWLAAPSPPDVLSFLQALGLPIVELYGLSETSAVAKANRPGRQPQNLVP